MTKKVIERAEAREQLLALELTTRCASPCLKCYRRHTDSYGHKMQPQIFRSLMSELEALEESYDVLLGTGEALLELDRLAELISWANKRDAQITLLTTGVLLSPRAISVLEQGQRLLVQVTFDGFVNEEIRHLQVIDLEKVKDRVRKASQYLDMVFNYTLYNHNTNSIRELIDFAAECDVRVLYITPVKVYERCDAFLRDLVPSLEEQVLKDTLRAFEEYARYLRIRLTYPQSPPKKITVDNELANDCAKKGWFRPVVHVDGTISMCWGREDLIVGRIGNGELCSFLKSPFREEGLRLFRSGGVMDFCDQCLVRLHRGSELLTLPPQKYTPYEWKK